MRSELKHTLGPWRISGAAEGAGITITAGRNTLVAFVRDNQHPLTNVTEHEATANARLIASAPDLLEALIKALACIQDDRPGTAAKVIHKAIADVDGERIVVPS